MNTLSFVYCVSMYEYHVSPLSFVHIYTISAYTMSLVSNDVAFHMRATDHGATPCSTLFKGDVKFFRRGDVQSGPMRF
jgi:hypothetical protein